MHMTPSKEFLAVPTGSHPRFQTPVPLEDGVILRFSPHAPRGRGGIEPSAATMTEDPRTMSPATFYELWFEDVWNFVRRQVYRRHDVEDIVQEVFETALRRRHTLDDPSRVRSWLFGIAARKIRNWRRLSWVRRIFLSEDMNERSPGVGLHEEAERMRMMTLLRALEALDPKLREPWKMQYFDGLSLDAIAARCGCSLAQVKRRIEQAKVILEEAVRER